MTRSIETSRARHVRVRNEKRREHTAQFAASTALGVGGSATHPSPDDELEAGGESTDGTQTNGEETFLQATELCGINSDIAGTPNVGEEQSTGAEAHNRVSSLIQVPGSTQRGNLAAQLASASRFRRFDRAVRHEMGRAIAKVTGLVPRDYLLLPRVRASVVEALVEGKDMALAKIRGLVNLILLLSPEALAFVKGMWSIETAYLDPNRNTVPGAYKDYDKKTSPPLLAEIASPAKMPVFSSAGQHSVADPVVPSPLKRPYSTTVDESRHEAARLKHPRTMLRDPPRFTVPRPRQELQLSKKPTFAWLHSEHARLSRLSSTRTSSVTKPIVVKFFPKASDFQASQLSRLDIFWAEHVMPIVGNDGHQLPVIPLTNDQIMICAELLQAIGLTAVVKSTLMRRHDNTTRIDVAFRLESQQFADRGVLIATSTDLGMTWSKILYVSELSGQAQVLHSADGSTIPHFYSTIVQGTQSYEPSQHGLASLEGWGTEPDDFEPMDVDDSDVMSKQRERVSWAARSDDGVTEQDDLSDNESQIYSGDEFENHDYLVPNDRDAVDFDEAEEVGNALPANRHPLSATHDSILEYEAYNPIVPTKSGSHTAGFEGYSARDDPEEDNDICNEGHDHSAAEGLDENPYSSGVDAVFDNDAYHNTVKPRPASNDPKDSVFCDESHDHITTGNLNKEPYGSGVDAASDSDTTHNTVKQRPVGNDPEDSDIFDEHVGEDLEGEGSQAGHETDEYETDSDDGVVVITEIADPN